MSVAELIKSDRAQVELVKFALGRFFVYPNRSEVWHIIKGACAFVYHHGQRPCIKTPLRFDDIQFYRIDDIHDLIVMIH